MKNFNRQISITTRADGTNFITACRSCVDSTFLEENKRRHNIQTICDKTCDNCWETLRAGQLTPRMIEIRDKQLDNLDLTIL